MSENCNPFSQQFHLPQLKNQYRPREANLHNGRSSMFEMRSELPSLNNDSRQCNSVLEESHIQHSVLESEDQRSASCLPDINTRIKRKRKQITKNQSSLKSVETDDMDPLGIFK